MAQPSTQFRSVARRLALAAVVGMCAAPLALVSCDAKPPAETAGVDTARATDAAESLWKDLIVCLGPQAGRHSLAAWPRRLATQNADHLRAATYQLVTTTEPAFSTVTMQIGAARVNFVPDALRALDTVLAELEPTISQQDYAATLDRLDALLAGPMDAAAAQGGWTARRQIATWRLVVLARLQQLPNAETEYSVQARKEQLLAAMKRAD